MAPQNLILELLCFISETPGMRREQLTLPWEFCAAEILPTPDKD